VNISLYESSHGPGIRSNIEGKRCKTKRRRLTKKKCGVRGTKKKREPTVEKSCVRKSNRTQRRNESGNQAERNTSYISQQTENRREKTGGQLKLQCA
jgi:hypothetical protein